MSSFKDLIKNDVSTVFLNVDEFSDTHTIDGKEMPAMVDDNEIIEREKKMKSNMDGVFSHQKMLYVSSEDFGAMPARGRIITLDGKKYTVIEATDEYGILSITLEANRSR